MADDALEEAATNIQLLIAEEMAVQHRLGSHPLPAPDCPLCVRRMAGVSRGSARP